MSKIDEMKAYVEEQNKRIAIEKEERLREREKQLREAEEQLREAEEQLREAERIITMQKRHDKVAIPAIKILPKKRAKLKAQKAQLEEKERLGKLENKKTKREISHCSFYFNSVFDTEAVVQYLKVVFDEQIEDLDSVGFKEIDLPWNEGTETIKLKFGMVDGLPVAYCPIIDSILGLLGYFTLVYIVKEGVNKYELVFSALMSRSYMINAPGKWDPQDIPPSYYGSENVMIEINQDGNVISSVDRYVATEENREDVYLKNHYITAIETMEEKKKAKEINKVKR